MKFGRFMAVTFLSLAMTGGAAATASAKDVIEARQSLFKELKKAMGTVKGVVDNRGPAADVIAPAQLIAGHSGKFAALFPKGSDKDDTKALPAIWSDWTTFEGGFKMMETSALAMVKAGQNGDIAEVGKAFGGVGGICSNCHDRFRAK